MDLALAWQTEKARRSTLRRRRGLVTALAFGPVLFAAALLLLSLVGRYRDGRGRWGREGPNDDGASRAFFEFAPADGAGMGTACAGTTPTGAKGETLTFTRASTRYCTKGNETTGIQNGDLVLLTSGQPAVMPGGDGTGALGLGIWEARTNLVLRSQEFDNVAWTPEGVGVAAPTITANFAVAPDNTTTAERIQCAATTGIQESNIYQTFASPGGAWSGCLYFRGTSGSGTTDFCTFSGTLGWDCTSVAYVTTGWTLIKREGLVNHATPYLKFGNSSNNNGGIARSATDFLVWGAQAEAGSNCSPYIPTAGTAATRPAELADVAITFGAGTTGMSAAATTVSGALASNARLTGDPMSGSPGTAGGGAAFTDSYLGATFHVESNASSVVDYNTTKTTVLTVNRASIFHTGAVFNGCLNGSCGAGSAAATWTPPAYTRFRIGAYAATQGNVNGVQKLICLDPDSSRCR